MFILLLTFIFRKYLSIITTIFFFNNPSKIFLKIFQGLFYIFFNKQFFLLFIFAFILNFVEPVTYCHPAEPEICLIPRYNATYLEQNFDSKIYVKNYEKYHNDFMARKVFIQENNLYVPGNIDQIKQVTNNFVNYSVFSTDTVLTEIQQLNYFLSKIHLKKALIMQNFTGNILVDESIRISLKQKLVQINNNTVVINYQLPQIVKDVVSKSVDQQINWNQIFNCLGLFNDTLGILSDDNSSRFSDSSTDSISSPLLTPGQMEILIVDINLSD